MTPLLLSTLLVALAGDTIGTAIPIPALPFLGTGNTCEYADDYDVMCPYGLSDGDVVYSFVPATDMHVGISLCESEYDTKLFVWENGPDALVACNDDQCGVGGYRSRLDLVPLAAGNTYYIIVDGFWVNCGTYEIKVSEFTDVGAPEGPGSEPWGKVKARYR